jgi:hypothetical protein
MVFNIAMNTQNASDYIDEMGGPSSVARLLNLKTDHAAQRVHNWRKRGIPLSVLVKNPKVFGPISKCQHLLVGSEQAASV